MEGSSQQRNMRPVTMNDAGNTNGESSKAKGGAAREKNKITRAGRTHQDKGQEGQRNEVYEA